MIQELERVLISEYGIKKEQKLYNLINKEYSKSTVGDLLDKIESRGTAENVIDNIRVLEMDAQQVLFYLSGVAARLGVLK